MIKMEVLKERAKQYIKGKDVCVIATCSRNMPRASTVNYVSDGFTLYIVTSAQSTKVRNIGENPNVSIAIDDQGKERLCLQAQGIATILSGREAEKARKFYCQFRDITKHKPELVDIMLRVELKEIMFSDYTTGELKVYKFRV